VRMQVPQVCVLQQLSTLSTRCSVSDVSVFRERFLFVFLTIALFCVHFVNQMDFVIFVFVSVLDLEPSLLHLHTVFVLELPKWAANAAEWVWQFRCGLYWCVPLDVRRNQAGMFEMGDKLFWQMREQTKLVKASWHGDTEWHWRG
jgi:hypothetical protein